MKEITQTYIARQAKVSVAYVNSLVQTDKTGKRPSWKRAKQIAGITRTVPELWLEGTTEEIKAALNKKIAPIAIQSQPKEIESN